MEQRPLKLRIQDSAFSETLCRFYGEGAIDAAQRRCQQIMAAFESVFGYEAQALFRAPGRTELGGNHTDHQQGRVLAAAVDLDLLAAVAPNQSNVIRLRSQGYPLIEVELQDLTLKLEEINTSAALIRGVVARMSELGGGLQTGGFDACLISDVPGGSGLSSSAAFEVLIGTILNDLFYDGKFTPVELAQIGQYAENVYFGKPCGLMDQTAVAVGGVVAIDFEDPAAPVIQRIPLDLPANGYALCILDSGAGHGDLTGEYAAITEEMRSVCRCFGKSVLREVDEADFWEKLPEIRRCVGDRAILRALHFYEENRRAAEEARALLVGDFPKFLHLVRSSGQSSAMHLQNIMPTGAVAEQALMVALAVCEAVLGDRGAVRVHGGGFGGTAQAFVPLDMLESFVSRTEAVLGKGCCHVVTIRPVGSVRLV